MRLEKAQLLSGTWHGAIPAGKANETLRLHNLVTLAKLCGEFRTAKDPALKLGSA